MRKLIILTLAMMFAVVSFAQKQLLQALTYDKALAVVKGQITNITDANNIAIIEISSTPSWSTDAIVEKANINADGTFEAKFNVCVNSLTTIKLGEHNEKTFYIIPGQTVKLTVDLATSKLTFEGPFAKLNNSLANYYDEFNERSLNKEINGMGLKKLKGFTVRQYKEKLLSLYKNGVDKLNADKRLSPEFREYMIPFYQYITVVLMGGYEKILKYANDGQGEYIQPADYYNDVKDWNFTAKNGFSYANGGQLLGTADELSNTTGGKFTVPDNLGQLTAAKKYMMYLDNLKTFTSEQLVAIKTECPDFEDMLIARNEVTRAMIEENSNNKLFSIKFVNADLTGEDILKTIIKDYRGKMMLIDFWATWCGPCKAAMKTILPIKEELWGKVAFIYITGETSPKTIWNNMIPEIHGDHYYVTNAQWETLLKQFEAQGIPTYVIVDKEGNIVAKHIGYPGNDVIKEELSK